MPKAITFVNDILQGIGAYIPSKDFNIIGYDAPDPDAVYAVFAHWNYERDCVEKWAGIKWIIDQCIILNELYKDGAFISKFSRWKICILSYETEDYFKSREKNKMLLSFKNIKYVQTPTSQLNDIKSTIQELSNLDAGGSDYQQFSTLLDKIALYNKLDQYRHDFDGGKREENLLTDFEKDIQEIPSAITKDEDVYDAINVIKNTLGDPKSDRFEEAYENLYEIIKEKLL